MKLTRLSNIIKAFALIALIRETDKIPKVVKPLISLDLFVSSCDLALMTKELIQAYKAEEAE